MSLGSNSHREEIQLEQPSGEISVCPECKHLTEKEIRDIANDTGKKVKIVYCPSHESLEEYFN